MVKTRRKKSKPPQYVCLDGPMDNVLVNMGRDRFQLEPAEGFNVPYERSGCYVFDGTNYVWTLGRRANHHGKLVK